MSNDPYVLDAAEPKLSATALFGPLPSTNASTGVFDRSHPKGSGLNGLYPGWRANLKAALAPVVPLIAVGKVSGIFLGDEVACAGVPFSNYSRVIAEVRAAVGPAPVIWANECGHPSGWPIANWPEAHTATEGRMSLN